MAGESEPIAAIARCACRSASLLVIASLDRSLGSRCRRNRAALLTEREPLVLPCADAEPLLVEGEPDTAGRGTLLKAEAFSDAVFVTGFGAPGILTRGFRLQAAQEQTPQQAGQAQPTPRSGCASCG